jgi:hypothetical protein
LLTNVLINIQAMKKFITITILLALFTTCTILSAQPQQEEYLGLPGDNLNLYAVMKLFQESETLEGFESKLNDENSRINNLDLNGDNYVDYIQVIDFVDGDVHNIVLQVAIDSRETQDVAVFTVQRFKNGQVQIQLIGDEELYGRNYIIEPIFDDQVAGQTPNPGYLGNSGNNVTVVRTTTYEIAAWPVIRFIYLPGYVVWRSSWRWGYYPSYWHPWKPFYWHYYYGYHYNWYSNYYAHYRRWNTPRYTRWNDFYYSSKRSYAPSVSVRIKTGKYKTTYSQPAQRRKGEALYTKMNPDQGTRRADPSPGNNSARRSVTQSNQNRQNTGTTTSTTRRTTTTVSKSPAKVPASVQNAGSTRRSSTTVTKQSVSNPQSVKSTRSNRTSGQTKATGTNSSSRRSSTNNKSGTAAKKSEKTKKSETTKTTRRK